MGKFYYSRFRNKWFQDDALKDWIEKVPEDYNQFHCKWCKFTGVLSNTGRKALKVHMDTIKHRRNDPRRKGGVVNVEQAIASLKSLKHTQVMTSTSSSSPSSSTYKNDILCTKDITTTAETW